jgi:hypothetical protein
MPERLPCLIIPEYVLYRDLEQMVQFKCADDTVREILWDEGKERVIVFDGDGRVLEIDCYGTHYAPRELTLRFVMLILGFDLSKYVIESVNCLGPGDLFENVLDSPISVQEGCQFTLRSSESV